MKILTQDFRTEASGDHNQPLELIDIYLDNASYYYVANNTESVSFFNVISGDQVTYEPAPITRSSANVSTGLDIDNIKLGIANVNKTIVTRLQSQEFRGRRCVVRKVFANMLDTQTDAVTVFDGLMDSPSITQKAVSVVLTPRIGSLKKKAPGRWYQLLCNWKFGSTECGIDTTSALYNKTKTASAGSSSTRVSGDDITEADGYWRRGYIEFTSGTNLYTRQTIKSSGLHYVELDGPLAIVPDAGDTFTVKAGCDKTLFMCSGDYTNEDNFGGFHTIPENMVIR